MDHRKKNVNITEPNGRIKLQYDKQFIKDGKTYVPVNIVVAGDVEIELADKFADLANEALG